MSDREMEAVLVTLAPLGDRALNYVDVAKRECDFPRMLRAGWSSGERVLIIVADSLWTGAARKIDLAYIAGSLGDPFLSAVLGGIAAYRGQPLPAAAVL